MFFVFNEFVFARAFSDALVKNFSRDEEKKGEKREQQHEAIITRHF